MNRKLSGSSFCALFALAFLFFTTGSRAQQASQQIPAAAPVVKTAPVPRFNRDHYLISYRKFVLNNGLTVIVHTDTSTPVVAVNLWYHVGSRNELPGKTGFAHLFEHFFFNGSDNYPHGFREAMDDVGANNRNGTTNTDRTNFFEEVPVSALERTLYLEADRMGFLTISKEMLERERGVVQNEKRQGENRPYGKTYNEIVSKMYPKSHPYSWTVIGSMDDLNAASVDDVKAWYKKYYGPNNVVLSLAGDISYERAVQLVKKYFDGIPPLNPITRTETWIPALDHDIRDEMQDRVPSVLISRVYHVPSWKEKDLDYLNLFGDILSGSNNSRLDRKLIYEEKLASSIGVYFEEKELGSLFFIDVYLNKDSDPVEVEHKMDAIVDDLIRNGPTQEEMNRAKSRNRAQFSRTIERLGGMGGRSDVLAQSMTYGGSPEAYLDKLENMEKAQIADVKRVSQKWLLQHHYTMVVKPYPDIEATKNNVDRSKLPSLTEAPDIVFPEMQMDTLKNGLKVMLLQRNTIPVVNFALAIDAGISSDTISKAGLSSLAIDLMDKGTKTRDVYKIADQLDLLGAKIETSNTLDMSFIHLSALTDNLQPSLRLFADVVLNPSFPEQQFITQKQQHLEQVRQEKVEPNEIAFRILPGILYGTDHPYGMPLSGSGFEKTIDSITRKDLIEWHATWFKPESSTLIVTGNISMEKLHPMLEDAFGKWKGGKAPEKNIVSEVKTPGHKIYVVDKPEALQSTIVAAHVSMTGAQDDEIALEIDLTNFGGMATSRLNRNLRLDKHWSYGTNGSLRTARGQRPFVVIAPVQTDKTKESMVEITKEIRGLAGERPLAGDEYASIMRNMTLRLPARFGTLKSLENGAIRIINYNLPTDYWSNYASKIRSLEAAQLNEAAKKYIHPDEIIWVIVGDLSKIEQGIKDLNYGEIVRLNADGEPVEPQ